MLLRGIFLPVAIFICLTACHNNKANKAQIETSPNKNFLQISIPAEVVSLDPSIGVDAPSIYITRMLFEGLMLTGRDGKIRPALAKSYEISDDLLTYTFQLKPTYWSNGEFVTAHDFAYSWKKIINPEKPTLGAENFYPIKNARAISRGKKGIDSVGIRVLDNFTLQVELEHPTPYFLETLSSPSFFPVYEQLDKQNPNWFLSEGSDFVCNGPYTLQKHRLENEMIVVKNPSYWNAKSVTMPGIRIGIIKDTMTQLTLFEKGELDWLGNPLSKIPLDAMQYLKKNNKLLSFQSLGVYFYYLNTESFPFTNKKIRQAFSYGIDRGKLVEHVLQGEETPATSVLPYSLACNTTPYFLDNDSKRARQLFHEALDELGITPKDLPAITINYPSLLVRQRIAEVLQSQWNTLFGIKIHLQHQEWKSHFAKIQTGNFQIGGVGWQSKLRDPIYIMQTFRDKDGGINMSRWENEDYQRLLAATEQEINPLKRKQLFNQAEQILMDEMPAIPLYFTTIVYAKSDRLKGVYVSDLHEVDFRWSYFEEK
ncbi:MAG: Oligopeptide-binding protein OppA [Chlamydiae bacterium]|nr:Oligopeptide-binding protein OppA [Chlamydiota bacterium]